MIYLDDVWRLYDAQRLPFREETSEAVATPAKSPGVSSEPFEAYRAIALLGVGAAAGAGADGDSAAGAKPSEIGPLAEINAIALLTLSGSITTKPLSGALSSA